VERFDVGDTTVLRVRMPSGTLRVVGGEPGSLLLRLGGSEDAVERFSIEREGETVTVEPIPGRRGRWSSLTLTAEVGHPPDVRARVGSCDIVVATDLASLRVEGASGEVRAEAIHHDVTVRTASGSVRIASVGGDARVTVASGGVRLGEVAGEVDVTTASGDIEIGATGGGVRIKSASGSAEVGRFDAGDLSAKTLSGNVAVGIPPGRALDVDLDTLSGRIRTDFAVAEPFDGGTGGLSVKTLSGNIRLYSVEGASD
jgi:DUF4097 and DUF4098 domain-containing protein YvlB